MNKLLKIVFALLLYLCFSPINTANAQITIDNYTTFSDVDVATAMIDTILGNGISFSNPSFRGVRNSGGTYGYQLCYFTTATTTESTMQISRGIALTSGNTGLISIGMATDPGASNSFSKGYTSTAPGELRKSTAGINDMDILAAGVNWFNGAVLEFDFVPVGDSVVFRYVFGGEEYSDNTNFTNYQCSQYNDKFGFLISGPGIAGGAGYDDDAYNMARLNNGSEVGINSVNNGTVGSSGSPNGPSYCENVNPDWTQGTPSPEFLGTIPGTALNGNTIPLYAAAGGLTPGETYHIKLLICDATDGAYDAIVYIEANSFVSPTPTIALEANPAEFCDGEDTWIVVTTTDLTAPINYEWSTGTTHNTSNPADSIQISPSASQAISVTVTDANMTVYTASVDITVNPVLTPSFDTFGPYCAGETADLLPASSNNSVNGTWSPTTINTSVAGTVLYTFTPSAGQCANSYTQNITVNAVVNPTFDAFGPYCQNSTADALPTTSNNSVNGTWNPATISTSSAGTSTYTFTPSAGGCTTNYIVDITITASITPEFNTFGPYCLNETADLLPLTSNNAITGTWSPATINTAIASTTTFTFTPDAGQCSPAYSIDIEVAESFIPEFNSFGPYCEGASADILPTTSNNAITGSWTPATINTDIVGIDSYVFTPDGGQCASEINVDITINENILPTFAEIGPYCEGESASALPVVSENSITGTWLPATVNTNVTGSTNYIFTPSAGQCATSNTIQIVVNPETIAVFKNYGPYCVGSTAEDLANASDNGITGNWTPAVISTSNSGDYTYTFTANDGSCTPDYLMTVTINESQVPTLANYGPFCTEDLAPELPDTSINGFSGTWNYSEISTETSGTFTYTFTSSEPGCFVPASTIVDVIDYPEVTILISDPELFSGEQTSIIVSGAETYNWFNTEINICDGCSNATFTAPSSQIEDEIFEFVLTSSNGGCSVVDTLRITVLADVPLMIPNGFSPNGDGNADTWIIQGLERLSNSEVKIVNRWGNKVYESTPYQNDWGGENMSGGMLPSGTYYYVFKPDKDGEEAYSGYVYINY